MTSLQKIDLSLTAGAPGLARSPSAKACCGENPELLESILKRLWPVCGWA